MKRIIPGYEVPYVGEDGSLVLWVAKFLPAALRPTAIAGLMEYDGTGIYLTPYNHRRFISLASDSIISTVEATTVAPTTLWTGVLNANELKTNRVYEINACGLYTTHDAADRATISLTVGGITIVSLQTPAGLVTNEPWNLVVRFTIRSTGAAGTFSSFGTIEASSGMSMAATESSAIDTTVVNNAILTCSWSDTLNSLKLTQCYMNVKD